MLFRHIKENVLVMTSADSCDIRRIIAVYVDIKNCTVLLESGVFAMMVLFVCLMNCTEMA